MNPLGMVGGLTVGRGIAKTLATNNDVKETRHTIIAAGGAAGAAMTAKLGAAVEAILADSSCASELEFGHLQESDARTLNVHQGLAKALFLIRELRQGEML